MTHGLTFLSTFAFIIACITFSHRTALLSETLTPSGCHRAGTCHATSFVSPSTYRALHLETRDLPLPLQICPCSPTTGRSSFRPPMGHFFSTLFIPLICIAPLLLGIVGHDHQKVRNVPCFIVFKLCSMIITLFSGTEFYFLICRCENGFLHNQKRLRASGDTKASGVGRVLRKCKDIHKYTYAYTYPDLYIYTYVCM